MLGPAQLNAEQFPTISYQADTCEQTAGQTIVHGSLTLHGVKKSVQTGLAIAVHDGRFTAKGSFKATHEDFDLSPFAALLGSIRNDTVLEFHLNMVATP